ncbi:hypothetical protein KBY25_08900 [Ruegeria pomeroyi]|nr:hypothetical protein [Ruegeria pomeroyi]
MEQIIAQLVGGALGGTGGGKLMRQADMGGMGNAIAGALGGLGGGQLLGGLMGAGGADLGTLVSSLVGGGAAGLVVQLVVGLIVKRLRG